MHACERGCELFLVLNFWCVCLREREREVGGGGAV